MPNDALGAEFASLFEATRVTVSRTDDFLTESWVKLCQNAVNGAVCGLTVRPIAVMRQPLIAEFARTLALECIAVGPAEGAKLNDSIANQIVEQMASIPNAEHHGNSLYYDRRAGRPMEFEARNVKRMHKDADISPLGFFARQVMMLGPASALVWIPGLWLLLRDDRDAGLHAFGFAYLVLLAIMMMLGAKDYYLAPIYPLLFAAGGALWTARSPRHSALARMKYAIPALVIVGGLLTAPLALPILSPEHLIRYEKLSGINNPRSQTGQEGRCRNTSAMSLGGPK